MPEVIVHAVEGRSAEQKKALCADITAAVVKHFNAPIDAVTVSIIDAPRDSSSQGGDGVVRYFPTICSARLKRATISQLEKQGKSRLKWPKA